MTNHTPKDPVLLEWLKRVVLSQNGQYFAARHYRALHTLLGLPLVGVSTLVTTSIVVSYFATIHPSLKLATLLTSIATVVMASLQTFFRFAERAEEHRGYGARYGALRRRIEQALAHSPKTEDEMEKFLNHLREQLDNLAIEAPDVPRAAWRKADSHFKGVFSKSGPITGGPLAAKE
jgi:hypothetical protein